MLKLSRYNQTQLFEFGYNETHLTSKMSAVLVGDFFETIAKEMIGGKVWKDEGVDSGDINFDNLIIEVKGVRVNGNLFQTIKQRDYYDNLEMDKLVFVFTYNYAVLYKLGSELRILEYLAGNIVKLFVVSHSLFSDIFGDNIWEGNRNSPVYYGRIRDLVKVETPFIEHSISEPMDFGDIKIGRFPITIKVDSVFDGIRANECIGRMKPIKKIDIKDEVPF